MPKPIDLWLSLFGTAVGVAMSIIPRTIPFIVGSLIIIFCLLAHPIWNFWWIEESLGRRLAALFLLAACLCGFGYVISPKEENKSDTEKEKDTQHNDSVFPEAGIKLREILNTALVNLDDSRKPYINRDYDHSDEMIKQQKIAVVNFRPYVASAKLKDYDEACKRYFHTYELSWEETREDREDLRKGIEGILKFITSSNFSVFPPVTWLTVEDVMKMYGLSFEALKQHIENGLPGYLKIPGTDKTRPLNKDRDLIALETWPEQYEGMIEQWRFKKEDIEKYTKNKVVTPSAS